MGPPHVHPLPLGSLSPPGSRHSFWTSFQLTYTYGTLIPLPRWATLYILKRTSTAVLARARSLSNPSETSGSRQSSRDLLQPALYGP